MLIIRHIDPASVTDPDQLANLASWLNEEEATRMHRFVQPRHQHAFLVSHALTRAVLAKALGCQPKQIRYGKTGRDKPTLLSEIGQASHIHFNLSHTEGLAAIAVSTEPVGLDVEWLARSQQTLDLAQRYFTATEHADILKQPAWARMRRFLTYWTLKEAYLKAEAWGIVDSLDGFEFLLSEAPLAGPTDITLRIRTPKLSPSRPWRFWHSQPSPSHLLSLAFVSDMAPTCQIDCRAWLPDEWLFN